PFVPGRGLAFPLSPYRASISHHYRARTGDEMLGGPSGNDRCKISASLVVVFVHEDSADLPTAWALRESPETPSRRIWDTMPRPRSTAYAQESDPHEEVRPSARRAVEHAHHVQPIRRPGVAAGLYTVKSTGPVPVPVDPRAAC